MIEDLDAGRKPPPEPVTAGALHPRDPAETPLISRRWGIKDSHKIDVYLQHDGYKALEKALREMTPESIIDEVKKSSLARARRRGLSDRDEVVVCAERFAEAEIRDLQRRRIRARARARTGR